MVVSDTFLFTSRSFLERLGCFGLAGFLLIARKKKKKISLSLIDYLWLLNEDTMRAVPAGERQASGMVC